MARARPSWPRSKARDSRPSFRRRHRHKPRARASRPRARAKLALLAC